MSGLKQDVLILKIGVSVIHIKYKMKKYSQHYMKV